MSILEVGVRLDGDTVAKNHLYRYLVLSVEKVHLQIT